MGPPARRLVQRPGWFRIRARASGTHRRNAAGWPDAHGAASAGSYRAPHLGGGARGGRRGVDHAADRHHHRHPATGPRRVPCLRPRTPAGGRGTAYRHRHGLDAGVRAPRPRGVRACQPALADQEAGGASRTFCRRRLHGADRHALANRTQFRHGVPVYRRCARRAAGDLAARTGFGGARADAARAARGAWRFVSDELFRSAGADCRL